MVQVLEKLCNLLAHNSESLDDAAPSVESIVAAIHADGLIRASEDTGNMTMGREKKRGEGREQEEGK